MVFIFIGILILLKICLSQGTGAWVVPDISTVSAMAPQLDVIDVRRGAALEDEDQFMLRTVERAHTTVVLVPDAQVLQLGEDSPAGCHDLGNMAPVHADVNDCSVDRILRQRSERHLQKLGEDFL